MDKKTLRKIIENLKSHNLVQTKDFKVNIKSMECLDDDAGIKVTKTLLLTPDCNLTNEELIA